MARQLTKIKAKNGWYRYARKKAGPVANSAWVERARRLNPLRNH